MPKKKAAKGKTPYRGSKSSFIRSMPAGLTAAQIIEAGKRKHGLKIAAGLVYAVRSADSLKGRGPNAERGHTTTRLRNLMKEVGPARAARILSQVLGA